jgi:AraC family transcriptional regulator, ethanolamine operon transcriptional activator
LDGLERHPIGLHLRRVLLRNPDEAEAEFAALRLKSQRFEPSKHETWTASGQLGALGFRATSGFGQGRVRGSAPKDTVLMQFDMGCDGPRRVGGRAMGRDDIGVLFGGAEFDLVSARRHRVVLFSLPHAVLADALHHRAPGLDRQIGAHSQLVLTGCAPHVAQIRALTGAAFESVDQPFAINAPRFAYGEILDTLVGALLSPWRRESAARLEVAHYHRLPIVRRVEEFMRSNLGEPITLRDLCSVARASERAVEYAFRDVYGVGAKQYLRLLRLNQVRRELNALPAGAAMVTDIAHRYGFSHLGHFSAGYRRLFGEAPRQTRGLGQASHYPYGHSAGSARRPN